MIVTTPHNPEPEKYPGGLMLGLTIRGRRVGAGLTLRRCAELMGLTMTDLSAVECVIGGAEFVIVDILFRMLRPKELAKAMGFRDDFIWPRTQRETVRLIGNAVSPPQARALVGAVFPGRRAGAA